MPKCEKCGKELVKHGSISGQKQYYCESCDRCKNCGTITDFKNEFECIHCGSLSDWE